MKGRKRPAKAAHQDEEQFSDEFESESDDSDGETRCVHIRFRMMNGELV